MKIIDRKCPLFSKGLDDKLEVITPSGKMSKDDIVTLRGLYDSTHEEPLVADGVDTRNLTDEEIAKYSATLSAFKKTVSISDMQEQKKHRMKMSSEGVAAAMLTLDGMYRGATKIKRIALMAKLFHQAIEKFKKDKGITDMSNAEVIDTYFGSPEAFLRGNAELGENMKYTVLYSMFTKRQTLTKAYNAITDKTSTEAINLKTAIEEYDKIIKNKSVFQALCIMASPQIKENDGVKYSLDFSYSMDVNDEEDAFSDIENYIAEETKKDGWMEHTDEVSSFKQMQRSVKVALRFIPKFKYDDNGVPLKDSKDTYIIETDEMGMSKDENPLELHKILLELSYSTESEKAFLKAIEDYGHLNPSFIVIHKMLSNNPSLLSSFRQEYTKTHIRYRFFDKKKGFGIGKLLSGNMFSKEKLENAWLDCLKSIRNVSTNSIFKIVSKGDNYEDQIKGKESVVFDKNKVSEFLTFIEKWFAKDGEGAFASSPFMQASVDTKKEVILKALEYLNIPITPEVLNKLFSSNKNVKTIAKALYSIYDRRYLVGEEPFSTTAYTFITSTVGTNSDTPFLDDVSNIIYVVENSKPRQLEHKVNWLGKKLFNFILPSMLSNIIDAIKRRATPKALREYIENTYFISSQFRKKDGTIYNRLLSDLYQDDTMASVVEDMLSRIEISRSLGTTEKDFTDFSEFEHIETLLAEFFGQYKTGKIVYVTEEEYNKMDKLSSVLYYIKGKPYYYIKGSKKKHPRTTFGNYSTFIQGDANQLKMVKAPIYSYDECVDGLLQIALSEIAYYKQKQAANSILDERGVDDKIIEDKVFGYLHFLNDIPALADIHKMDISTDVEKLIKEAITNWIEKEVGDIKATLSEGELLESFKTNIANKTYPNTREDVVNKALSDFVANYALNLACLQQISTISASLFKGAKDFAKRNKGTHSNGKQLNVHAYNPYTKRNMKATTLEEEGDDIQKVLILKEVILDIEKVDPKFAKYVEKVLGKEAAKSYFKGISSTDGQGYRLIDSYYKIKVMAGEDKGTNLTEWYTKYKELQKRAKDDNRDYFTEEEIAELEAIDYTPQPIKPITQAINQFALNSEDTMLLAQQHKYAEIILIPEMLPKGSRLKAIGHAMQATNNNDLREGKTNVDLCIFNTGVKVGSYGAIEVYNDGNGGQLSDKDVFNKIKDGASKVLHRVHLKYTKIQTNTPEHVHDSRGFGTQLRKIILQGVVRGKTYSNYVKSLADRGFKTIKISKNKSANLNDFKGVDLIRLYNAINSANYIEDFNKIKALLKDKKGLSRSLIQQTVLGANGNLNEILAYCLNSDGTFFSPLFDAIRAHDAAANFLSMYKKTVNTQRVLGGSAVQASSFGITEKQEDDSLQYIYNDKGEVIGAECEMVWDVRIKDADGNEIALKFEDWCNEDGTLKTDSKGNILLDKYYPNARKLIAYRIPTEDFYSVMNLEVKRYTRKTATGGILKVPPQGVVQAGFDFDIDKLYLIRYEYRQVKTELTEEDIYNIWSEYYDAHPDVATALTLAQELDYKENGVRKKLHEYWGVGITAHLDKQEEFNKQKESYVSSNTKFEEYDPTKTPLQNSRVSRNNLLWELIWNRMADPETARMRLTPGGFDRARDAAKFIRELIFHKERYVGTNMSVDDIKKKIANLPEPEPERSVISVNTIIRFNKMNQIADKLIGVFANHNSNAMMASLMHKLNLGDHRAIKFGSLVNKNVTIKQGSIPIPNTEIGTNLLGDTVEITDDDGNIISSHNILSSVHELIAAAVDAVKDPVLNYLGMTTLTASAAALLGRLGYTSYDVGLLFNQPVVKEYLKRIGSGSSKSFAYTSLKNELSKEGKIATAAGFVTESTLLNGLTSENALASDTSNQLAILDLMYNILGAATAVADFVKVTKNTAANSVSSSFSKMYEAQHSFEKLSKKATEKDSDLEMQLTDDVTSNMPLSNYDLNSMDDEDYLDSISDSPFAYEQAAYDCNKAFLKAVKGIFPYETSLYKRIRNWGYKKSLNDSMSEETIDQLHNDILLMALASKGNSVFDPMKIVNIGGTKMYMKDYALITFPSQVEDILAAIYAEDKTLYSKYPILDHIEIIYNKEGNADIIIQGFKDNLKEGKYELAALFEDLFFSEDPRLRNFAQMLIMNQYYKNGFNFNTTSFGDIFSPYVMSCIRANVEGDTYYDILNLLLEDDAIEIDEDDMITKFVQNHPDNTDFVKKFKNKNQEQLFKGNRKIVPGENNTKSYKVEIPINDAKKEGIVTFLGDKKIYKVPSFVSCGGVLYKATMSELPGDATTVVFEILPKLGDGKYRRIYTNGNSSDVTEAFSVENTEEPTGEDVSPEIRPEDVEVAYSKYQLGTSDLRATYMRCMQDVLGVDSISKLPSEYTTWDKKELLKGLARIFNEQKVPIMVYDVNNGQMYELC